MSRKCELFFFILDARGDLHTTATKVTIPTIATKVTVATKATKVSGGKLLVVTLGSY